MAAHIFRHLRQTHSYHIQKTGVWPFNCDVVSDSMMVPSKKMPLLPQLLVPYRGTHYHLTKWGHANI